MLLSRSTVLNLRTNMINIPIEIRKDLELLYLKEFEYLSENSESIQKKARTTGTAAGVILGFVLTLLGNDRLYLLGTRFLFFVAIGAALFFSGLYSLRALKVINGTVPLPGKAFRDLADSLISDSVDTWCDRFHLKSSEKRIVFLETACSDLHKLNEASGASVDLAQRWLVTASAIALFFLIAITVFH